MLGLDKLEVSEFGCVPLSYLDNDLTRFLFSLGSVTKSLACLVFLQEISDVDIKLYSPWVGRFLRVRRSTEVHRSCLVI